MKTSRIVYITAIGVLLSTSALARIMHPPAPTKEYPGDAPVNGVTEGQTINIDPAAGDVSIKFNRNATIVKPESGRQRTPEIINPAKEEAAAPVPVVSEVEAADPHEEEDVNEPEIHAEANGVRFVSGGIGDHDIAHMKKLQPDFRLKLEFSASSGHYLSGVTTTLTNKEGEAVLTMTTEGPTLLVDVPPGSYNVTATYDNAVQTKQIAVPAKGTRGYTVVFTQPVM